MQENKLHLEEILMETSKIIPYQNNAKIHTGEQISLLASHIAESGWDQPIVVDKDMVIIKGHGRLMAAMKLGLKRVPVKIRSDLTPNQVKAARIADNKISDIGGYDEELLKVELEGLHEIDVNLADIGIDDETISSLGLDDDDKSEHDSEKEDDIPEVEQNIYGVKRGDIWLLGKHRVMCGDSTDKADVDRLMDGSKADMVFTDPPYGIRESSKDHSSREKLAKPTIYKRSDWDHKIPDKTAFDLMIDNSKEQIIFGGNYFTSYLEPTPSWIVWNKKNGANDFADCELAWTSHKKACRLYEQTWHGMIREGETGKRVHPTQKPIALSEWCFEKYGDPKSVLDLFLGSGSTLIACEKTDRQAFGMEIDPHYCSVIIQRYIDYVGDSRKVLLSTDKGSKSIEEVLRSGAYAGK